MSVSLFGSSKKKPEPSSKKEVVTKNWIMKRLKHNSWLAFLESRLSAEEFCEHNASSAVSWAWFIGGVERVNGKNGVSPI